MKKIILLIDDDEDEVHFFAEALHEIHFPCDFIYTGSPKKALNLLYFTVPDFIFVDFNMPLMNGLKCIEEIKKVKHLQRVPVILYSNKVNDELTRNAMAIGAMFCIRKPDKIIDLCEILKHIFSSDLEFNGFFRILKGN